MIKLLAWLCVILFAIGMIIFGWREDHFPDVGKMVKERENE